MIPLYFCATTRAGSWLWVRRQPQVGQVVQVGEGDLRLLPDQRPGTIRRSALRSAITTAAARSVSWRWVYTTCRPAAPLPAGPRPPLAPSAMK